MTEHLYRYVDHFCKAASYESIYNMSNVSINHFIDQCNQPTKSVYHQIIVFNVPRYEILKERIVFTYKNVIWLHEIVLNLTNQSRNHFFIIIRRVTSFLISTSIQFYQDNQSNVVDTSITVHGYAMKSLDGPFEAYEYHQLFEQT